ncbi:MAG TPA: hypothetical protein VEO95_09110 [Chthoniobacteraceae bacterium]|nr:hypothetical protein [Chthoniobacteraceae bacterium]
MNELDEDPAEPLRPRGEELIEEVGILRRAHPGHSGIEGFRRDAASLGELVELRRNDLEVDPAASEKERVVVVRMSAKVHKLRMDNRYLGKREDAPDDQARGRERQDPNQRAHQQTQCA